MSVSDNDELAQALALSLESSVNAPAKTPEELRAEEEEELQRVLQMSMQEAASHHRPNAAEEEMIARVTELSLATEDTLDEDLRRAIEESEKEHLSSPPRPPHVFDSVYEAELQNILALSRMEASSDSHQEKMDAMLKAAGPLPAGRFRQCVEVAKNTGGLVVGVKFKNALAICEQAGGNCTIKFLSQSRASKVNGVDGDCLVIEADSIESLNIAENAIIERVACTSVNKTIQFEETSPNSAKKSAKNATSAATLLKIKARLRDDELNPEQRRHVFVDNSNLFIGAQTKDFSKTGKVDYNIRVNARRISQLLHQGGGEVPAAPATVAESLVAGSKPPASGAIWKLWENVGFKVKVCSRDADTGLEDLVDDFLHAQISGALIGRQRHADLPGSNTLVLCTGDGNDNGGFNNFYEVVINAIELHWRVEIWTWRHACSNRFMDLLGMFPDRMSIIYLDRWEDTIVFNAKTVSVTKKESVTRTETIVKEAKEDVKVGTEGDGPGAGAEDDENMCIDYMEDERPYCIVS